MNLVKTTITRKEKTILKWKFRIISCNFKKIMYNKFYLGRTCDMYGKINSLNASVAAGIMIYEMISLDK